MSRLPRFILFTALALSGCHREHHVVEEEGKFLVTNPLRKDTELTKEYVAQVRAIQHIELRALEKGYLQGVYVDEGQAVPSGKRMSVMMALYFWLLRCCQASSTEPAVSTV